MKDWRIIVISATLAFILSLIFGLFGHVSLGILLIRALSGAVIFAAIGFGSSILLRRYLPELYELQEDHSIEIKDGPLEAESLHSDSGNSDSLSAVGAKIDISIDDEAPALAVEVKKESDDDSTVKMEKENDLVDEISEDDKISSNIDVLPDMGVFSNSFEGNVDDIVDGASKTGAVTLDIMGEEQDPELVVRAVRTMVKKDQEG